MWYQHLTMRPFVESQIAAKRARLLELDRERLTVEAELRTYEEMLGHLVHPQKANGTGPDSRSGIPSEMTPGWRKILCRLDGLGRAFGAADIVTLGEEVGAPTNATNARSQLYQWDKKHVIVRVRKGKYRLAEKGKDTIRKSEGLEADGAGSF